jgi:Tol biopolymer transport system component/DNA-binding winged helix-turn-helix (wHTH) protein
METAARSGHLVRFKTFELNLRTRELRRDGLKLKLNGHPIDVLEILLEQPGELVTRETLQKRLWPEDTFVDFEHGLNNSINRVREVLGDKAEAPQFIETLPRLGYRFIAPVEAATAEAPVSAPAAASAPLPDPQGMQEPVSPSPDAGPPSALPLRNRLFKNRWWWAGAAFAGLALLAGLGTAWQLWQLWQKDYFWKNPLDGAKVERLTDFDGDEFDAAISSDGKLVVFSSDRAGPPDVWLTEIGSGQFVNISKGSVPALAHNNGSVRALGFSRDGSQVWSMSWEGALTWIGPAIGGVFRPFLEAGLEPAWSPHGSRIVFHTTEAGDPFYIADRNGNNPTRIFVEKPGIHCHFLTWSPDGRYIYFAKGTPTTEEMDIWRIPVASANGIRVPERITHQNSRVAYLSWLDSRTLVYTATADDGTGQWLYSLDVERRVPHRVSTGLEEQYLTVSVSDTSPRRLVASVARPSASLWTVPISDGIETDATAVRLPVPNARAFGPRVGSGYLLFLSGRGGADGLWRLENGSVRVLWNGSDGGLVGPPAIAPVNGQISFAYRKGGHASLHIMSANGTNVRALAPSLDVRGGVSWSPDGKWIAVAADRGDGTKLFKVPVNGGEPVQLLDTLAYSPIWSPDGKLIVYSGAPAGGEFAVKAVTPDKSPVPLPAITVVYNKGNPYRFLPGENALIVLEGSPRKQDFFRVDLGTGKQRQLTDLQPGFRVQSFDVSQDGKQIIFDRLRDNADVVLMELSQ